MLFGSKQALVLVGFIPDQKMATGGNWSGLMMIVPNSHYTRVLRKPEKLSQEESLAEWSARSRVRSSKGPSPSPAAFKFNFQVPIFAC